MKSVCFVASFPIKLIPVAVLGTLAALIGVKWEDIKEQSLRFLF